MTRKRKRKQIKPLDLVSASFINSDSMEIIGPANFGGCLTLGVAKLNAGYVIAEESTLRLAIETIKQQAFEAGKQSVINAIKAIGELNDSH